mmetsp:Transcript_7543/g.10643  ORF Transcript_7543/g.10643 Transcript_7543/m.10643 type:complete len:386 (-) Transcript_7543:2981-4138(-)
MLLPIAESINILRSNKIKFQLFIIVCPSIELCFQHFLVFTTLFKFHSEILQINMFNYSNQSKKTQRFITHFLHFYVFKNFKAMVPEINSFKLLKILCIDEIEYLINYNYLQNLNTLLDFYNSNTQFILIGSQYTISSMHRIYNRITTNIQITRFLLISTHAYPIKLFQYYSIIKPRYDVVYLLTLLNSVRNERTLIVFQSSLKLNALLVILKNLKVTKETYILNDELNFKQKLYNFTQFLFCQDAVMLISYKIYLGLDIKHTKWLFFFPIYFDIFSYLRLTGRISRLNNIGISIVLLDTSQVEIINIFIKLNTINMTKINLKTKYVQHLLTLLESNNLSELTKVTCYIGKIQNCLFECINEIQPKAFSFEKLRLENFVTLLHCCV